MADELEGFTADELDKLPKWARDKVIRLYSQARLAIIDRDAVYGVNDTTRIELKPNGSLTSKTLNLSDDAEIKFYLGDNPNRQDWISFSLMYAFTKGRYPFGVQMRASYRCAHLQDSSNSEIVTLSQFAGQVEKDGR